MSLTCILPSLCNASFVLIISIGGGLHLITLYPYYWIVRLIAHQVLALFVTFISNKWWVLNLILLLFLLASHHDMDLSLLHVILLDYVVEIWWVHVICFEVYALLVVCANVGSIIVWWRCNSNSKCVPYYFFQVHHKWFMYYAINYWCSAGVRVEYLSDLCCMKIEWVYLPFTLSTVHSSEIIAIFTLAWPQMIY